MKRLVACAALAALFAFGYLSVGSSAKPICPGNSCHTATTTTPTSTAQTSTAQTTTTVSTTTPQPAGGWTPIPPTSYKSSGSITLTKIDTATGPTSGYALFFPTKQHIVHNQYGIFAAYSYYSNMHQPEYWRLKRSIDGGATWTTLYDSQTAGQLSNAVTSPTVETDQQGDVFLTAEGWQTSWLDYTSARVYKFSPSNNFGSPQIIAQTVPTAGKFTTAYDQTRNLIWVLLWEEWGSSAPTTLYAYDTNGNLVKQIPLWGVQAGNQTSWDQPHYPILAIASDGTIYAGATMMDAPLEGTYQNYYDTEFVYSPDGGNTWYGKNGVVTLPIDPIDETKTPMFEITDTANPAQFIAHSNPLYGSAQQYTDWNMTDAFAFNHGEIHAFYSSLSQPQPTEHTSYTRWSRSTKQVDLRMEPFGTSDVQICAGSDGNFVQDTTEQSRLYFIGAACNSNYGRVAVLYSDDGGTTWHDYALSAPISTGLLYTSAFRWVNSDGSLDGVTSSTTSSGTDVYYIHVS